MFMKIEFKISIIALALSFVLSIISYADVYVDKRGKEIIDIAKPTAESTVYPNTISDAVRRIVREDDANMRDPNKNIVSNGIFDPNSYIVAAENTEYSLIRHTASITDIEDDNYSLVQDFVKDRLKLTIRIPDVGEMPGKNGFFRINGKVYYFDEDGLMVLGPAYDNIGNYYYFSYDTGELLEERQVR